MRSRVAFRGDDSIEERFEDAQSAVRHEEQSMRGPSDVAPAHAPGAHDTGSARGAHDTWRSQRAYARGGAATRRANDGGAPPHAQQSASFTPQTQAVRTKRSSVRLGLRRSTKNASKNSLHCVAIVALLCLLILA